MAKELISLITPSGQNEQVDPRVLPPQQLRVAQNVRFRKDGRAAKRYGNLGVGFATLTDYPNAIFALRNRRYVAGGAILRAKYGSTVAATGSVNIGEVSRFLPRKFDTIRTTESTDQPEFASVAGGTSKVGYWWEENGTIYRRVLRTDNGSLVEFASFAAGEIPRSIAVGTNVNTVLRDGTNLKVSIQDFSIDLPSVGTPTTIGTLTGATSLFDAAERNASTYLTVHYSAANQLTAQLMTGTTVTSSSNIVTVGAPSAVSIFGTAGENVYVAWVESTGALKIVVFNSGITAVTGATATVETVAGNVGRQPLMIRRSSTSVSLFWSSAEATANRTRWTTVTNAAVSGTIRTAYNIAPASRPFLGDGNVSKVDMWVSTDNTAAASGGTNWANERNYFLATFDPTANTIVFQLNAQPLRADDVSTYVCQVVSVDSSWYTCLGNVLRSAYGSYTAEAVGLTGVSIRAHNTTLLADSYRQSVHLGQSVYLAGNVTDVNGAHAYETGFAYYPAVASIAPSAGGSVDTGSHIYRVVYECIDDVGRRHRSAPSEEATATTTAGNNQVDIYFSALALAHANTTSAPNLPLIRAHIYRTKANQSSPFYRITPNTSAQVIMDPTASVGSYVDTLADSNLGEILYTDGGVLPNIQPPSCRYLATTGSRLILGGLFVANKVVVSKVVVEGEPVQFTDDASFQVDMPEDVTAVASLDDTIVVFSAESIFVITGDGPNDQGIGAYGAPHRLPSSVGCIDHRSVVETPDGLMFQSKRGIYLLPRGFSAPVFIGAEIQETLGSFSYVQGAFLCIEPPTPAQVSALGSLPEGTVRFICSDADPPTETRVLIYDLRTRMWSFDDVTVTAGVGGIWDDRFTFTRASLAASTPIRQEELSIFGDNTGWAEMVLETGDIRPFGITGWGDFTDVTIAAEYRGECTLMIDCWVDGEPLTKWSLALPTAGGAENTGDVLYLSYVPETRTGSSIRIKISDTDHLSAGATEGVVIHGIQVSTQPMQGPRRMPAATHRGP